MNEDDENEFTKLNKRLRGGCLFLLTMFFLIVYAVIEVLEEVAPKH